MGTAVGPRMAGKAAVIVLGITGPIGHGKTTFANALAVKEPSYRHIESNMPIIEVANAMHAALTDIPNPHNIESLNTWLQCLPDIVREVLHVETNFDTLKITEEAFKNQPEDYQKLVLHVENLQREPSMRDQLINPDNKDHYRPLLQWLGGYFNQKIAPSIWYTEIIERARQAKQKGCNLCIVGGLRYPADTELLRRKLDIKVAKVFRPDLAQTDTQDPTERERENIRVDTTISNNGTIEDLQNCAKKVWQDLQVDQLKTWYTSA